MPPGLEPGPNGKRQPTMVSGDWRFTLKAAGAVLALIAVFCLGMWLTAPKFPVEQNFIPYLVNGQPIIDLNQRKLPSFRVRREGLFSSHAYGVGVCNSFGADFTTLPFGRIRWGKTSFTAVGCRPPGDALETAYFTALRRTTHWRTQDGALILENGTDVVRFYLAPR